MHPSQPLESALLEDLHPTQMTVGAAEVALKRGEWARLRKKAREQLRERHWFPAVKGPGGRFYIVDHHHLGLALHEERVKSVWVMPLEDFSDLEGEAFWRLMEFRRWAHPYDGRGRRRGYEAIPTRVADLRDDPYRSLAGFVRQAGGYAKDTAPFAEFLWADFFRRQPGLAGAMDAPAEPPSQALLARALALAHAAAARHLPGWSGQPGTPPAAGPRS